MAAPPKHHMTECGSVSHTREQPMTDEYRPKYRWRKTWCDQEDDFSGFDGPNVFSRFHIHHMGYWGWSVFPYFVQGMASLAATDGTAPTARDAARDAESCYDSILAGTWPGMKPHDIERAAKVAARRNERWRDVLGD